MVVGISYSVLVLVVGRPCLRLLPLTRLNFCLYFLDGLIDIALGILGDTQNRLTTGGTIGAYRTYELRSGRAMPFLEELLKLGLAW